jgi:rare lipoprotein A
VIRRTLLAVTALAVVACGGKPPPRLPVTPPPLAVGDTTEGVASWYGPGFDGRRTSSGERFDPDQLTAAHGDWAFGTHVKVTLLSSGRSVVVRINDRLPRRDRIIDLSKEAARQIGLIGPGIGRVQLEVVEVPGGDGSKPARTPQNSRRTAMQPLDLPKLIAEHRQRTDPWHEFFRVPDLSLGIYRLRAGAQDAQTPHDEDEIYYVLSGRGRIRIGDEDHDVAPGDVVYVAKRVAHQFHDISEDLELLVFFAPAEGSTAGAGQGKP